MLLGAIKFNIYVFNIKYYVFFTFYTIIVIIREALHRGCGHIDNHTPRETDVGDTNASLGIEIKPGKFSWQLCMVTVQPWWQLKYTTNTVNHEPKCV